MMSTALNALAIPASKSFVGPALAIKRHRALDVRFRDRPAIGAPHQRGENRLRARLFFGAGGLAPARRSASGRHTNNRRRLGVFSAPFASYGPVTETWSIAGALRGWRLSLKCDCRGCRAVSSSDEPSLTNVTPISCGPARTVTRAFKSLSSSVSSPSAGF